MITYYAFIQDEKIQGSGNCPMLNKEIKNILISKDVFENLDKYIYSEGEVVINENYEQEQLDKAREEKIKEATDKAYSFEEKDALITVNATNMKSRASGIYHIEGNLTNNIKLSAYASSITETDVVPWNTKENVNVLLNKTACLKLTSLMSQLNAKLWTVDFPAYLAQIEACETKEDVEAIEIEYQNPAEIVDVNIPPEEGETVDENTTGIELPEVQENSDISEDNSGEDE